MALFEVAARFDAPAEAVWAHISWHGMARMTEAGFFSDADFPAGMEIRPGALRRVKTPDGGVFVERLIEHSEEDFLYTYRIIDTGPFPLTDYTGIVAVTPAGSGCCLKLGHTATLVDVSEDEWRAAWLAIEHQVFDYIRARVS